MFCRKETDGALGRRLITLLCVGWLPHDIVFVAEAPLSLIGHSDTAAQAFAEDFPDRGRVLLPACKYVAATGTGCLPAFSLIGKCLFVFVRHQVCQAPR